MCAPLKSGAYWSRNCALCVSRIFGSCQVIAVFLDLKARKIAERLASDIRQFRESHKELSTLSCNRLKVVLHVRGFSHFFPLGSLFVDASCISCPSYAAALLSRISFDCNILPHTTSSGTPRLNHVRGYAMMRLWMISASSNLQHVLHRLIFTGYRFIR